MCASLCVFVCDYFYSLMISRDKLEMQVITDKHDCSDFRGVVPVEVLIKVRYFKPLFVLMLMVMAYSSSQKSSS